MELSREESHREDVFLEAARASMQASGQNSKIGGEDERGKMESGGRTA